MRPWYERSFIHLGKHLSLFFGGAMLGGFIGWAVITAILMHGMAMITIPILGVAMLWIGSWITDRLDEEQSQQDRDMYNEDNYST